MLFRVRIRYRMGRESAAGLPVTTLELLHEADERIDAFGRHRVVDARAHAADGAMPVEVREPGRFRFREEGLVELRIREREWHVHERAAMLRNRVAIEARGVDGVVQLRGLRAIALGHPFEAAI